MSFTDQLKIIADKTEKRLSEIYEEYSKNLESLSLCDAIKYSLLNGGKRVRAYLVSEFCEMCGVDFKYGLDYGCALEMIHAFSLIHDDLPAMDNDDMRRGKPSNHKAFGESTAILAGDALALDAFLVAANNEYCSAMQNLKAVKILSKRSGSMGMCYGQQLDLEGEGQNLDTLKISDINLHKTGDLFSAACNLGCIAGNCLDGVEIAYASPFGYAIGEAFQITDDLLDITQTSEELGKTAGKDSEQKKSTYVSILGLEKAKEEAERYIESAKKCLDAFPDCEAKERLTEFCDYILIRKK